MNNIKTIILLCFLYYISTAVEMATDIPEGDKLKINKPVIDGTVNLNNDVAVDMEIDTPEVDELEIGKPKIDTSEIDDIVKWSNTLKPVKVVDWRCLYSNLSGYEDYSKKELAITRCPTHIVNDLARNYNDNRWPPGMSYYEELESNKDFIHNYNCRLLPSTSNSKEVVVVLASDNKMMIEDPGFVMFFSKGGTSAKKDIIFH